MKSTFVMETKKSNKRKEKGHRYQSLVNKALMDELTKKIVDLVFTQKKYKEKGYSARKLAEDLGTNTRYVSAVVNLRFNMNYSAFINKYRINEAVSILSDVRYRKLRIEEVSDMVGFSNRQSFYTAFSKWMGVTPREFRLTRLRAATEPPKEMMNVES